MKKFVMMLSMIVAVSHGALAQQGAAPDSTTRIAVPEGHRAKGRVFHTITGKDRQIYFESNAPLESIKGQSNQVIGYAVMSNDRPGQIVAAEWRLPVESMKTGIALRDEHMAGKDWLDAESFPNIVVRISAVRDLREVKRADAFTTHTATLVGDVTIHGVTKPVQIPGSTITTMRESDATRKVAPGDLVAIRSKFTVALADFGVSHPVIGEKVANEVAIDVSLYLASETGGAR